MKSNCKNCGKEVTYSPSQSKGLYCSWNCSAADRIKTKFALNTNWSKHMGTHLKKLRGERCEECGITEHNGKPIIFQVDHMNGDRADNRFENLKILCPNCHSQTSTFGVKNVKGESYKRMIEGGLKGSKLASLKRSKK
jgi:DNA-directed RNA polymerase subunit RPC12/RpoP